MSANQDTGKVYCSAVTIQIGGNRGREAGPLEFRIDLNNRVATPEGADRQKSKPDTDFAPEFGVKPRRQFVDEGQPAKFKVSFEGLPRPEVTWSKDGKILKNDSKTRTYEEEGYHFLEIQNVSVKDKGNYSCLLSNKIGKTEAAAELNVFEKPKSTIKKPSGPSVTAPLQDQTAVEGEKRFVLDCSFDDAMDCSATWYKDGEEIKPGREFRARFDGRVASLTISRVLEEDIGKYECVVAGPAGEARTKCSLKVEVSNEKREPPVFVRELKDMEVNNGDKVELLVEVKGSDPIDVFWIHNNREITPQDTECHLITEGNVHRLVIPRVCQQDTGEYVCEAYSDLGDTDTFCRLSVRDVALPAPPEFASSPRLLTTEEGSSAMYTCRVKGHPTPKVSWEKDGQAIVENSHFKSSIQGDECILEVLNTTKSDAGSYTCSLSNPSGETSHTATLVVKEKTDFRSVLKTRQSFGKLGKQNSTDSEKSDKENEQLDFRKVLRRGERTPPGGHEEKKSRGGVNQLDFRNVLKTRAGKPDAVLATKSKATESTFQTLSVKSRESSVPSRNVSTQPDTVDKPVISEKSVFVTKSVVYATKVDNERFEKSSNISLKKTPPREENLKNKMNKFEQISKSEPPPVAPKMKTSKGSLQGRLSKFETSSEIVKTKTETIAVPSKHEKSVLGRLNKFEQLSSSETPTAKRESPISLPLKPKGNVLEKYSFTEKSSPDLLNGKSKRSDLLSKVTDKSVKLRMERFEKLSDTSTPQNGKHERLSTMGGSLDSSLRTNKNLDNISPPRDTVTLPVITRPLTDQRVRYGHQAVLMCEVFNGTVDWSVNGKAIKGSKFFKMSVSEENVVKLTIAEAYSEDEGEYVCTATNKYGSTSSSCKLFVEATSSLSSRSDIEGSVTTPARLLSISPSSLAVTRGQEVAIEATFSGDPKPEVRWFNGRDEIQKSRRINIETTADRSVLTIKRISSDDAGKYIVAIENHAAKDSLSASVSVEDVPEPPGMPQANDIMRTSVILWWCGSPYDGGSQITHYKVEMKKYIGSSDWTVLTSNCKNTFYQVQDLEEKTAYYFRVYAANKHGYSSAGEMSDKIFTSDIKISLDYESDDELPFEPRFVEVDKLKKFEDQYEVMNEVGKGKFGNVYKCRDKESDKIWAAKILKCREKEKANIRHEIEIMNDLAHPKLMMLWDAFEAPRSMTLVMEFVGGGELFERVISEDFELTEGDCVHFMRQICDGVGYIHDKGIIHLDLKPENILCISDSTNQVKIIDFGLARRYQDGKSMKVLFGTPEFIAPEVINYDEISFATDMWSLGVICYLLLTGLSPFLGDNDAETLANVTLGDYDFDDESFDEITENAKDFIRCILIKNKNKRHLIKQAQQHVWLAQDERRIRNKRLNTDRLKRFMARRKWQFPDEDAIMDMSSKTGTAIRAIGRMASLQRLMSGSSTSSGGRDRAWSCDSSGSACWDTDSSASDKANVSSSSKVHDDGEDIDGELPKQENPESPDQRDTTLISQNHREGRKPETCKEETSQREVTLESGLQRESIQPDSKTCSDHNGNIAINKQNGFKSDNSESRSPTFLKEMLDCEAFTGDVIRFDVRVAGSPDPDVHWLHEDEEVQEDRRHIVEVSDNGQCSLIIRNVTEEDDGEYSCVAVNSLGEASCSAELIVCSIGAI